MSNVPLEFDSDNFLLFYQSIGNGNLNNCLFYKQLPEFTSSSPSAVDLLNTLLGVLDPQNPKTDVNALYTTWSDVNAASDYASVFGETFLEFPGSTPASTYVASWSLCQEFASYLIQYYFTFRKDENDPVPRLVAQNSPGYYPPTEGLYTFFQSLLTRGIANATIQSYCTQILDLYSSVEDKRRYVSLSPELLGWCGCFTPTDPDALQVDSSFPPECDPLCVNGRAIKLFQNFGQDESICTSAVCVLSNVSLNAEGSSNRTFNFNQICNACQDTRLNTGGQPCRCIIDSEFSSVISKIGANDPDGGDGVIGLDVGVTFERYCPNSICYIVDQETGSVQTLECNKLNPSATAAGYNNLGAGKLELSYSTKISFNIITLLMVIVLILIFLCLLLITKSQKKVVVI